MHSAKNKVNVVFYDTFAQGWLYTFQYFWTTKYEVGRNHLMRGLKPKTSKEKGQEWLDRLGKMKTVMTFPWGKLNCVCHMFFISTSRVWDSWRWWIKYFCHSSCTPTVSDICPTCDWNKPTFVDKENLFENSTSYKISRNKEKINNVVDIKKWLSLDM